MFESEKTQIQTKAAEFVSDLFDFNGNNKVAEYANEKGINYRDFASAVIAEVKRQLNG